jgi:hypothetical protein
MYLKMIEHLWLRYRGQDLVLTNVYFTCLDARRAWLNPTSVTPSSDTISAEGLTITAVMDDETTICFKIQGGNVLTKYNQPYIYVLSYDTEQEEPTGGNP